MNTGVTGKKYFENISFSIESGGNYRNYLKIIIKIIYSLIYINKYFIYAQVIRIKKCQTVFISNRYF